MERIGIYGGSFSPPHNGHLSAARLLLEEAGLDRLLILPAGVPPHKALNPDESPEHRLAMARLAFADLPRTEVSDWEMTQPGKSYTVLTLEHFSAPGRQLVLLVGTDMFLTLDRWYRAEDIFAMAEIVCVRRELDKARTVEIEEKISLYREHFGAKIRLMDERVVVLSSTELRGIASAGGDLSAYLPESVAAYIGENNLYAWPQIGNITPAALNRLREHLRGTMSPARYAHTLGVEQTALRIGALCAPQSLCLLRAAALLHDATKEYSFEKQLKILGESAIMIGNRAETPNLHAISAAAMLEREPAYAEFADPVVVDAVRCHTTGGAKMSVEAQIIYLADYIEPGRRHAACQTLARDFWAADPASMSAEDRLAHLRRFVRLEAEQTIAHLMERGAYIDEETLRTRNSMLG